MRVAFRTDASVPIGNGHLARCLSLADALSERGAVCHFVLRQPAEHGVAWVRQRGFAVSVLEAQQEPRQPDAAVPHAHWSPVGSHADAGETVAAIHDFQPDWIVVDHYAFDARWHSRAAETLSCRIAVIDDLADRDLRCALLIDHNIADDHAAKYGSHLLEKPVMLGGPRYALLGRAYADAPRCQGGGPVRSLGIFMGGADASGHSLIALEAGRTVLGQSAPIEIATTRANPGIGELERAAAADPATVLSIDLPDLAAFYARHAAHFGAGGGSAWERCCIGAPTVAVLAADNQRPVLEPLARLGVVRMAAPRLEALVSALREMVDNAGLRKEMSERARQLVDGRGAARVADHMAGS